MPKYILDFGPTASGLPTFTIWRNPDTGLALSGMPTLSALVSGYTDFTYSGLDVLHFRAELPPLWIAGTIDPRQSLPAGEGPVKVDHDYGGTDALRVLENGTDQPVSDAFIYVYSTSDFNAGNIDRNQYLIAWTVTKDDGRWRSPVYLDAGDYTLFILKSSAAAPVTTRLILP